MVVDRRTFVTDEERSLQTLFGPATDASAGQQQTALIATRLATAFATLQEFPVVRFRWGLLDPAGCLCYLLHFLCSPWVGQREPFARLKM